MNHHPSQIVFLADSSPLFDRPRDTERHSSRARIPSAWLKKGEVVDHTRGSVKIDRWTHTYRIFHAHDSHTPRVQDAYLSPLPSSPSSMITRPKFTSDPTIIFHGFAEWLRSFGNKSSVSRCCKSWFSIGNFKGCSKGERSTGYLLYLFIYFFFTHWYSRLRCALIEEDGFL